MPHQHVIIGVFESIGVGDCVVDLRQVSIDNALQKISKFLEKRKQTGIKLRKPLSGIQKISYAEF